LQSADHAARTAAANAKDYSPHAVTRCQMARISEVMMRCKLRRRATTSSPSRPAARPVMPQSRPQLIERASALADSGRPSRQQGVVSDLVHAPRTDIHVHAHRRCDGRQRAATQLELSRPNSMVLRYRACAPARANWTEISVPARPTRCLVSSNVNVAVAAPARWRAAIGCRSASRRSAGGVEAAQPVGEHTDAARARLNEPGHLRL